MWMFRQYDKFNRYILANFPRQVVCKFRRIRQDSGANLAFV